jgi:hypothetical protein
MLFRPASGEALPPIRPQEIAGQMHAVAIQIPRTFVPANRPPRILLCHTLNVPKAAALNLNVCTFRNLHHSSCLAMLGHSFCPLG